MTDLAKTTETDGEDSGIKLAESKCVSCRGTIIVKGLHGGVLQKYLEYRYEGGEQCPSCYIGLTVDREKPMNRQEWLDGSYPIDGENELL